LRPDGVTIRRSKRPPDWDLTERPRFD
jgi:hypothetical protein